MTNLTRAEIIKDYWQALRDPLLTLGGIAIAFYETLVQQVDRPYILAVAVAMMGIPWAIKADQWFRSTPGEKNSHTKDEPPVSPKAAEH